VRFATALADYGVNSTLADWLTNRSHEKSAEAVDVGFRLPSGYPGNVALSAFGRLRIAQGFPPAGEAEVTQRRARCSATGREGPWDA
jgi:hypothetical protein